MILKIINILKLIRINNILIAILAVIVSNAILQNKFFLLSLHGFLTVIFTMAFGNV